MASNLLFRNPQRPFLRFGTFLKTSIFCSTRNSSFNCRPFLFSFHSEQRSKNLKSFLQNESFRPLLQLKKSFFSSRNSSTTAFEDISKAQNFTNSTADDTRQRQEPLQVSKPIVAYWFFATAFLVFGIVILGGVTRLTESGLSIVEWNLIKGMKPPTNEQEWSDEFEKYKAFPEYQL
jgi:hypothetical protein